MEVTLQQENEDGSADYLINMTPEETEHIVRFALIEGFKKLIEEGKKYDPASAAATGQFSMGNTGSGEVSCKDGTGEQSCESGQCRYCPEAPKVSD